MLRPGALAATAEAAARPIAGRALFTGPRLIDGQRPALEQGAIEVGDGLLGAVLHLDEAETARPAGVPVGHDLAARHAAELRERLAEVIRGGAEGKISDVQTLAHGNP